MKIKNDSRVNLSINISYRPPVSLHLAPGEISKDVSKELIEKSPEVRNLFKMKALTVIAGDKKKEVKPDSSKTGSGKEDKK